MKVLIIMTHIFASDFKENLDFYDLNIDSACSTFYATNSYIFKLHPALVLRAFLLSVRVT